MYQDDKGNRIKLDTAGRPYRVGADGWRVGRASERPAGVEPAVWAQLRPILQKENKTYEQFVEEAVAKAAAACASSIS